jgi:hypothetical protein
VEGGGRSSQPPRPRATEALLGGLVWEIVKRPGARDVEYVAWQIFHYPTFLHTAVCSPQMALCRWRDPMGAGVRLPRPRWTSAFRLTSTSAPAPSGR